MNIAFKSRNLFSIKVNKKLEANKAFFFVIDNIEVL